MVPTLQITQLETGQYHGHVTCEEEVLGDIYEDSLEGIIRVASSDWNMPIEGMHIWYDHVSAGTIPADEMYQQADALSEQLHKLRDTIEDDSC